MRSLRRQKKQPLDVVGQGSAEVQPAAEVVARVSGEIRRDLAERGRKHYVESVLNGIAPDARSRGVSRSERATALALYNKDVMDSAREREILTAFMEGFGFRTEAQMREASALWHRQVNSTMEQAKRDAITLLKTLMAANPEERADIREQLFGEIAVGVNGNGNGSH